MVPKTLDSHPKASGRFTLVNLPRWVGAKMFEGDGDVLWISCD